ncbi:Serine/threonine-protein kinase [Nymphaea thermarum]|nr:Serine/threonine-protein kinase [Nymphaea thermarum]
MERYELVKDIGAGNFGVAKLVRDKRTRELFAVKYIERGQKVSIRFFLSSLFTCISLDCRKSVIEILNLRTLSWMEARHLVLKFVTSATQRYCLTVQSAVLHSQPKSTVGTPAYIAPEVLARRQYDGKIADVWSCGVTLYVMLVGAYPFEDPEDPKNFKKTIGRILSAHYAIPNYVRISAECCHLLTRIFVANPEKRITIPEIKNHPWFLKNLPIELIEGEAAMYMNQEPDHSQQSMEEIMMVVQEARKPTTFSLLGCHLIGGSMDMDDMDADADIDIESSGDFVCAV